MRWSSNDIRMYVCCAQPNTQPKVPIKLLNISNICRQAWLSRACRTRNVKMSKIKKIQQPNTQTKTSSRIQTFHLRALSVNIKASERRALVAHADSQYLCVCYTCIIPTLHMLRLWQLWHMKRNKTPAKIKTGNCTRTRRSSRNLCGHCTAFAAAFIRSIPPHMPGVYIVHTWHIMAVFLCRVHIASNTRACACITRVFDVVQACLRVRVCTSSSRHSLCVFVFTASGRLGTGGNCFRQMHIAQHTYRSRNNITRIAAASPCSCACVGAQYAMHCSVYEWINTLITIRELSEVVFSAECRIRCRRCATVVRFRE